MVGRSVRKRRNWTLKEPSQGTSEIPTARLHALTSTFDTAHQFDEISNRGKNDESRFYCQDKRYGKNPI